MRLVSWNVNGLRACMGQGFMEFFHAVNADIVALQETKLQPHQIELELDGYEQYWHSAEKKGYSGTAVFTKQKPLSVSYDLPDMENLGFPNEGRVITLEFDEFYFVNCYTPNSQRELTRLEFRMDWEDEFRKYLTELDKKKPVIMCGDLNVAHEEIDLKNPKNNHNNAGFTDKERAKFTALMQSGFVDSFRYLYPDKRDCYSWWSYMANSRARNIGWRIDYFVVSERFKHRIEESSILPEVTGSDHCPVMLEIR
mgnify:FL=1